jgi:uncharacterized SAM-binding protein YcdF (DUF218 family)
VTGAARQSVPGAAGSPAAPKPTLTWRRRLRDLLLVGLAFLLGATALTAYTTFRIWQVGQQDGRRHVDAIVVLGAAQYNGRPSPVLAARLDHAIELYDAGYATYLVTTGGKLQGDNYTEAQTGFNYATKRGVPASAILMETTGRTTLESMQHVKAIFDANGLHTALFVSDRSHMLRVLVLAQDQGIEGWGSPTETSPDDIDPGLVRSSMVHELGGLWLYVFGGEDPDSPGGSPAAATQSSPPPQSTSHPSSRLTARPTARPSSAPGSSPLPSY